jgi:TolB-like protein/Flp pilus assembly protein TadD
VGFLAELKRRNVFRMAGLYLVAAWLLTQVAATLLPVFGAPDWVMKTVVAILAAGFFPALGFAWAFELTPSGLRRDADVPAEQSIAPQTARRMERLFLSLLVLALAFFAFDKFILAPKREASLVAATTDQAVAKTVASIDAQKSSINARSIAVLPFTNMSGDAANEYFSDGISEEILNVLAGTPELQVAARTSSFSFKGKSLEVPEIAEQLNVRMVLEGSVRKQGDKVRITAQLIDASNGFHVWSETYDRDLTDIFAVQDEIAQAIGQTLQLKIGSLDGPRKEGSGTQNLEAYDLYLQGMTLWHTRREQALWDAIAAFERATALDPDFAQAYAGQALAYAVIDDYSNRMPFAETLARARDFAERALVLDPALPEIYAALGQVAAAEGRRGSADALFRRAIALRPSFATAHQWRGTSLMSSGDLVNGLASLEQASALDPRSRVLAQNHSFALRTLGRDEEAKARCQQVFEFAPDYEPCMEDIAMAELALGKLEAAEAMFVRQAQIKNPSAVGQGRELVQALAGKGDQRALALRYASLPFKSNLDPGSGNNLEDFHLAPLLVMLGERDIALDYLERFSSKVGSTAEWSIMLPAMDPIRCEPRFVAVVRKLGTHDPHFSKVCGGESP